MVEEKGPFLFLFEQGSLGAGKGSFPFPSCSKRLFLLQLKRLFLLFLLLLFSAFAHFEGKWEIFYV